MPLDEPNLTEKVLEHVAEIAAGTCSITDEGIAEEVDPCAREILAGLLMLHEDLEHGRRQQSILMDELREAVRARDDFLTVASHELRTPITTLGLQLDGILRAVRGPAPAPAHGRLERRLEIARRQVDRLGALVAELVDVSRITSGKLQLSRERADLTELVRGVAERFDDDAQAAGSALRLEAAGPIWGDFDVSRVDQVVTNLVSNAIRYGGGRPITIGAGRADGWARVWVEDHGIGIPPEHQERIFRRFERVAPATSYGGLGLGLWITQRLIAAMGGTISVRSQLGRGALFTVQIPALTPHAPRPQAGDDAR